MAATSTPAAEATTAATTSAAASPPTLKVVAALVGEIDSARRNFTTPRSRRFMDFGVGIMVARRRSDDLGRGDD